MHDHIPRKKRVTETNDGRPRRANELLKMFANEPPPAMLFDEFWREGEISLLFGPAGTGKSMLAVQIGEALARGCSLGSFQMPEKRQRVLYVDLKLSDKRFVSRYKGYHFSENFHRVKTALEAKKICDWLRERVKEGRFKCVILDDLSSFRETCDGTRETLKLMRHLSHLRDELDISMLVLSDCREPRKGVMISERELMRSRILCEVANSVFAIGPHVSCPHSRSLVQTRSIEQLFWQSHNAPTCWQEKTEEGLAGLVFDKRFAAKMDDERVKLIVEIRRRWNLGERFRAISADLGISNATASRLCKQWRPGLEEMIQKEAEESVETPAKPAAGRVDDEIPEWEEAGFEKPIWEELEEEALDDEPPERDESEYSRDPMGPIRSGELDTPRSILSALGFRQDYDKNDREVFIEREDQETGLRYVWYRFDRKRKSSPEEHLVRVEYNGFGTTGMPVDGPMCLFNSG